MGTSCTVDMEEFKKRKVSMFKKFLCLFSHDWVIYSSAIWKIPHTIKKCVRCGKEKSDNE